MQHSGDLEILRNESYLSSILSVQFYYQHPKSHPLKGQTQRRLKKNKNEGFVFKIGGKHFLYCDIFARIFDEQCSIYHGLDGLLSFVAFPSYLLSILNSQVIFLSKEVAYSRSLLALARLFVDSSLPSALQQRYRASRMVINPASASMIICIYNNLMLSIAMEEFVTWFETKMDAKYAMKMESLKRSLIFFYNLADQVVSLYHAMRVKMEKYSDKQQYKDILGLLNRSLIIIAKITDRIPICLDSQFCDKFIKTFDFNINLLCTYYHSLSHFELLKKEPMPEKDKIVEGINKMYTIHLKIKDVYKHNLEIIQTLTLITEYKRIFNNKINSITNKLKMRKEANDYFANDFQAQAIEFYEGLLEKIKIANEEPDAKKSLMRVYFQLVQQQLTTQARLQQLLDNCMRVCGQIRSKKKNISFIGMESCNQLTRWVNLILKPSISLKNIKKLKVQEFVKAIATVLQEKETFNYFYMEYFENTQEEVQSLTNLIIDIAKQLEKIEQAGLLTLIADYRDSIIPNGEKKFINRLIDYHTEMSRFYSLHEEIKQLQRFVQSIVLQELGLKVNILIEHGEQPPKTEPGKLREE